MTDDDSFVFDGEVIEDFDINDDIDEDDEDISLDLNEFDSYFIDEDTEISVDIESLLFLYLFNISDFLINDLGSFGFDSSNFFSISFWFLKSGGVGKSTGVISGTFSKSNSGSQFVKVE